MLSGSQLRRFRRFRDLSQRELAALVQCSEDYITKIETGRRKASPELTDRILRTLSIPRALLVDGECHAK